MRGLLTAIKSNLRMIGNTIRRNAPELMIFGGILGGVTAGVLACKETVRVQEVIEEGEEEIEAIEEAEYDDEKQRTKDKIAVKAKILGKSALIYMPSVALGTASIISILGGHKILKLRHLATVATLAETTDKFNDYRKRVIEKYGPDVETKLLTDKHNEKVEETVIDEETGKEKSRKVNKTVLGNDLSIGYKLRLDRSNCYRYSNDFEAWMREMELVERELNNVLELDEKLCGSAVVRLDDILKGIGMKRINPDTIRRFKDAGVYRDKDHPNKIDLGLKRAQELKDWCVVDESEMELCISLIPDVWGYVDLIKKGEA